MAKAGGSDTERPPPDGTANAFWGRVRLPGRACRYRIERCPSGSAADVCGQALKRKVSTDGPALRREAPSGYVGKAERTVPLRDLSAWAVPGQGGTGVRRTEAVFPAVGYGEAERIPARGPGRLGAGNGRTRGETERPALNKAPGRAVVVGINTGCRPRGIAGIRRGRACRPRRRCPTCAIRRGSPAWLRSFHG